MHCMCCAGWSGISYPFYVARRVCWKAQNHDEDHSNGITRRDLATLAAAAVAIAPAKMTGK